MSITRVEFMSLGTVACEVQVGANYLSFLQSEYAENPLRIYLEKRMEKAKKLLKVPELPTWKLQAQ